MSEREVSLTPHGRATRHPGAAAAPAGGSTGGGRFGVGGAPLVRRARGVEPRAPFVTQVSYAHAFREYVPRRKCQVLASCTLARRAGTWHWQGIPYSAITLALSPDDL